VKVCRLSVGEERVWPPDLVEHLVTNAQLVLARIAEVESRVVPVLTKVEVQREVLSVSHIAKIIHILRSSSSSSINQYLF